MTSPQPKLWRRSLCRCPALPSPLSNPLQPALRPAPPLFTQVLSPQEASAIVCEELARGRDPAGAAHTLCSQAVQLAEWGGPKGSRCAADNTTAAVFDLGELG